MQRRHFHTVLSEAPVNIEISAPADVLMEDISAAIHLHFPQRKRPET